MKFSSVGEAYKAIHSDRKWWNGVEDGNHECVYFVHVSAGVIGAFRWPDK